MRSCGNKADIPEAADNLKKLQAFAKRRRIPCHVISAATRLGLKELVYAMKKSLDAIDRDGEATKRLVRRRPTKA